MNRFKFLSLVVISIVIAVLLATALTSYTRVSDSALADVATPGASVEAGSSRPSVAGTNYLPIIFLNSATAGGAWLLAGNAGTIWATDFLGTTDNMTLTFRVSNTVAYRIVPAADPYLGFAPNLIGGSSLNSVAPGLYGATIAGGGVSYYPNVIKGDGNYAAIGGGFANTAGGTASFIGGGSGNTISGTNVWRGVIGGGGNNTASAPYVVIGGGFGNQGTFTYTVIGGGFYNTASGDYATVGGGYFNTANGDYATVGGGGGYNTAGGTGATVGGGWDNTANGSYATVGGGYINTASGDFVTVGGGSGNTASGQSPTVGGGSDNTASGTAATVGGGSGNTANRPAATVGGGYHNTANGSSATVGGGDFNTANGDYATVGGGFYNTASGKYSLAAGNQAQALHQGAFVWADSYQVPFTSTADNQFLIRANGNVGINTNVPARTLELNGKIGVIDNNTRTYYGGIATEVNSQIINFGINDDNVNRFGGAYSSTVQGGFVRVDTRTGFDLFQFEGRKAGTTTLSQLASLNSAGKFTASGGFNGQCLNGANFNTTAGSSCNMDVAEGFAATEWTAPGDVVALVTHPSGAPTVRKATGAEEEVLVGVVSQNPGLVFDNGTTHLAGDNSKLITADKTVVALVGRVNVKVSVENGVINIGDALTSSRTPGMAKKATEAGRVIGYAMEEANADGMVLALVQPGDHVPAAQWEALKQNAELQARVSALEASQSQSALMLNALVPWGVVGLVAVWAVRRGRGTLRRELRSSE